MRNGSCEGNWPDQWKKAFTNCFLKVDYEVGGGGGAHGDDDSNEAEACSESTTPETAGSMAVVSIILPTHIIVANCGDSRVVLSHRKIPMPLSVDHKPDRDDEYERLEAAGGKVIQWNETRVFGVLAM